MTTTLKKRARVINDACAAKRVHCSDDDDPLSALLDERLNLAYVAKHMGDDDRRLVSTEYRLLSAPRRLSLRRDLTTKCTTSAAALRWIVSASGDEWIVSASSDPEHATSGGGSARLCQVSYDSDDHRLTFDCRTGNVYHSYYARHALRRERGVLEPGALTIARARELYTALFDEPLEERATIVIYEPPPLALVPESEWRVRVDSALCSLDDARWQSLAAAAAKQ